MELIFQKRFKKQFDKLNSKLKNKVRDKIDLFISNPNHKTLCNHPLKGSLKGKRAIKITDDIRVIFLEEEKYTLVFFLEVGTHNKVYK